VALRFQTGPWWVAPCELMVIVSMLCPWASIDGLKNGRDMSRAGTPSCALVVAHYGFEGANRH